MSSEDEIAPDCMWGLNYPFFDRKLIGSEKGYSDAYMMAGIFVR